MKPVAKIVGADEYGPIIEWSTHWAELKGAELCVRTPDDAILQAARAKPADQKPVPIYQRRRFDGSWIDSSAQEFDEEEDFLRRIVYTQPPQKDADHIEAQSVRDAWLVERAGLIAANHSSALRGRDNYDFCFKSFREVEAFVADLLALKSAPPQKPEDAS